MTDAVVTDAELVQLGTLFAVLTEALGLIHQETPEGAARAQAITDALQPICDRSRTLRATTLAGFRAKAVIAGYWAPTEDHVEAEELPWQMHASLVRDLMEIAE